MSRSGLAMSAQATARHRAGSRAWSRRASV